MTDFADRLRIDRLNAGLTVRQLANVSGISFSYITKIETRKSGNGISAEIIRELAKALGRDELEYLYLSSVIPKPLNALIADDKSRVFIRTLLKRKMDNVVWDRLQAVLKQVQVRNSKPGRKTVA
jgi:transcriptional regulator with XRE-family HTH domain